MADRLRIQDWHKAKTKFIAENLGPFELSLKKDRKKVTISVPTEYYAEFRKMAEDWRQDKDAAVIEVERKRIAKIFESENPVPTL